jgi:hypothetical protein
LRIAAAGSQADLREASEALAGAMQSVGPDRWLRFLADAEERARHPATIAVVQASQRQGGEVSGIAPRGVKATGEKLSDEERKRRNERDLARVISTEARGEGEAAMRAVGWTVINRMRMNDKVKQVDEVWDAYRHGGPVTDDAKRIARDILNGTIPDPTSGATHFYSPQGMPKEGEPPGGMNIWGGLESVPGVTKNGVPVRNSRPDWTKVFEARHVNGVPESVFKFFRDNSQDKKSKKGQ